MRTIPSSNTLTKEWNTGGNRLPNVGKKEEVHNKEITAENDRNERSSKDRKKDRTCTTSTNNHSRDRNSIPPHRCREHGTNIYMIPSPSTIVTEKNTCGKSPLNRSKKEEFHSSETINKIKDNITRNKKGSKNKVINSTNVVMFRP